MSNKNVMNSSEVASTEDVPSESSSSDVVTKYRMAADITNEVLRSIVDACKPGESISKLCQLSDQLIEEKCDKLYTKKGKTEKLLKGVAFPTSINPNELCENFSPLHSETLELNEGDLVKINLGCHIDGYIAVAGHSFVLGTGEITGRKADVLKAAWIANKLAIKTINVGATNRDVTSAMQKAVEPFKCKMVQGIKSHQLKQHVIDGIQAICSVEVPEERVEPFTFKPGEVYSLNVLVSTGEGKLKESDQRTRIYQRNVEQTYSLRTPGARHFLREITTKYPTLPFTIRSLEDENLSRLGVSECTRHNLLKSYPVLTERPNELIAQFKCTVMLLPSGTKKVTGLVFSQENVVKSDYKIEDPQLLAFLSTPMKTTKKKSNKQTESSEEGKKLTV